MSPDLASLTAGILPKIIHWAIWISIAAVALLVLFIVLKSGKGMVKYTTKVVVFSRRMYSQEELHRIEQKISESKDPKTLKLQLEFQGKVYEDKGGWVTKMDGTQYFRLKKAKVNIEPPEYMNLIEDAKNKNYLLLLQIANDEFLPINNLNIEQRGQVVLKTGDKDIDFWRAQQMKSNKESWGKHLDKMQMVAYGTQLATIVICLVFVYMIMNGFQEASANFSSASNTLETATNALSNIFKGGSTSVTPNW